MPLNQEIFQKYLAYKIPAPERFIFLIDRSNILTDLLGFNLYDSPVQVTHYENDLQLRLKLEWAKDEFTDNYYCIISNKSDQENLYILDFISRSSQVVVTPQDILNFSGKEHWTDAVNWLHGDDFWRCLDTLVRIKDKPQLSMLDQDRAYLASALLDTDLTRRFDDPAGFIFYFKKMASANYRSFQTNYPQLSVFVEAKLFTDVPELKSFAEQPELLQAFWLGYPAKAADKIIRPDKSYGLRYELAARLPHFVCDQVEQAESAYFRNTGNVDEFLKSRLTSDTLDGWTEYIRKENMLFEPLKAVLKRVVETLIRKADFIDLPKLADAAEMLKSHLAFKTKASAKSVAARTPSQLVFNIFMHCVHLYTHLRKGKQFLPDNSNDSFENFQEFFVSCLSKIPLLIAQTVKLNQDCEFLSEESLLKIKRDTNQVLADVHLKFAAFTGKNYPKWLRDSLFDEHKPVDAKQRVFFPFNFIRTHLSSRIENPLYIVIFDGMRWDGWEFLRPQIEEVWFNRKRRIFPMLTPLPGVTQCCRPFLLSGKVPPKSNQDNEWELLKEGLGLSELEVITFAENRLNLRRLEGLIQSAARLKVIIFDIFDKKIHTSDLALDQLYREIELEFQHSVRPILENIPKESPILLFSDHGFIEPVGKVTYKQLDLTSELHTPQHRRYVETGSFKINRKQFIYFSHKEAGMSIDPDKGIAFIRKREVLQLKPREKFTRYAHGGISPEEMIVPLVQFEAVTS